VERQKNEAIDAQAICEAAQRPSMRFLPNWPDSRNAAFVGP
jgi:transposase